MVKALKSKQQIVERSLSKYHCTWCYVIMYGLFLDKSIKRKRGEIQLLLLDLNPYGQQL